MIVTLLQVAMLLLFESANTLTCLLMMGPNPV